MVLVAAVSALLIIIGFAVKIKSTDKDSAAAGTGVIFLGLLILLTQLFFLALFRESSAAYALFILILAAAAFIKIYGGIKRR